MLNRPGFVYSLGTGTVCQWCPSIRRQALQLFSTRSSAWYTTVSFPSLRSLYRGRPWSNPSKTGKYTIYDLLQRKMKWQYTISCYGHCLSRIDHKFQSPYLISRSLILVVKVIAHAQSRCDWLLLVLHQKIACLSIVVVMVPGATIDEISRLIE